MGSILTIDIGATKTRMVEFDSPLSIDEARSAKISGETEFHTPHHPNECFEILTNTILQNFPEFREHSDDTIIAIASTGQTDGNTITSPSIGWDNYPLRDSLSELLSGTRVILDNDGRVGAVGAFAGKQAGRGLYVAIGTGIGGGMIINGEPSSDLVGMEIGKTRLMDRHETKSWEELASGSAFYRKYGRLAQTIPDNNPIWHEYAGSIAKGLIALTPTLRPDEVIIGGAMAEFFPKYSQSLIEIIAANSWGLTAHIPLTAADPKYTVNRGALIVALRELGKS